MGAAGKPALLQDLHEVVIDSDCMVAMRDGTRLATDVHRPARGGSALPGRFPVLLERTPYNKAGMRDSERTVADPRPKHRYEVAAYFAQRGYVVVFQDCRGRYASEGRFTKYLGEAEDGFDTMAWILEQPWCNGSIGTLGVSYGAHTQTALATLRPPGLKAMFLDCGGFSNAYRGGIRHGGTFELKQATWAFKHAKLSPQAQSNATVRAALEAENIKTWFAAMPWKRGHSPLRWVPEYEDYFFDQWERGAFDDYWRQRELYAAGYYDCFDGIPVMLQCGWWDPYVQTTEDNYLGISGRPGGKAQLVFGPWTHGMRSVRHAGDVDFGDAATLDGQIAEDYSAFRLQWFDRWLRPELAPPETPTVRYFRMGGGSGRRNAEGRLDHGGEWRSAANWPLPGTAFTTYFLQTDGRLSTAAPSTPDKLDFDFDPANPVPTIGGTITSGEPLMHAGAYDQRTSEKIFGATPPYLPLAARQDILVFETADLAEDVEITGPITVRLWVSSDAPDTDITAKLIDWHPPCADYPQGYAMNLTDGILRLRYRHSWEKPELLKKDEIAEIVIEPMPTSNLFRKGHRIRLDISSSNFPRFDVNPNTGEPEGKARRRQITRNTVHIAPERPSQIVLPVNPAPDPKN